MDGYFDLWFAQNSLTKLPSYKTMPFTPKNGWSNSFRIKVRESSPLFWQHNVSEVSIAVPTNAMGNRLIDGVSYTNPPKTIEILLFDKDGNQCYSHPSVPDVEYFQSVEDLLIFLDDLAGKPTDVETTLDSKEKQIDSEIFLFRKFLQSVSIEREKKNSLVC